MVKYALIFARFDQPQSTTERAALDIQGTMVRSSAKTRAAFGTATLNDQASTRGFHPGTKPVGTLAFDYAGLKCSFHGYTNPNEG